MSRTQIRVFLLHVAATLFMTGLIWFVQVVHYPLFSDIGGDAFAGYAAMHSVRTSWVVVPVMFVEMATAIAIVVAPPPEMSRPTALGLLVLLVLIWLSTLFVQVPRHVRLTAGFDAQTFATLVATNWIRTCGWTVRSVLLLVTAGRSLRR